MAEVFVGRAVALRRLSAALDGAMGGTARLALVRSCSSTVVLTLTRAMP